jgi:hypothetical protein
VIRSALLALALLLLLAAAAPAASGVRERRCGDVAGPPSAPQDVRAAGVSCRTAKRLARRHEARVDRGERCDLRKPVCRLDGWRCRRTFFGNSGTRVRCSRGAARLRFFYGV